MCTSALTSFGRIAEAVDEFVRQVVGVLLGADEGDAAVKVHALLG
jgi:hypothetical protein